MKNFITLSWIAICFFIIPKQSKSQNLIISGGNDFSVAVCENGYVFTWGRNNQNQMGLSSDGINPYPAGLYNLPQRVFGLEQVERVDAGSGNTSVALTCSGRVQTWGSNEFGELGNGRPTSLMPSSAVPQYVLFDSDNNGIPDDTLRNIKVVSGGNDEIFAITADNRLVSWGENNLGQLGNGTTINRNFANYVLDGTTGLPLENVITVEAGDESGYALIDNDGDGIGTVYSWGSNGDNLELGRSTAGTFDGRSFPVVKQDNSPLTDIRILSAGDRHVLALDVNGNIWSWGGDWGNGQLGQTTSYDSNPYARKVAGGESGALFLGDNDPITKISASQASSAAVSSSGVLYTWGSDGMYLSPTPVQGGQLGRGCLSNPAGGGLSELPLIANKNNNGTIVPFNNAVDVSDGDGWFFVFDSEGTIWVAGYGGSGALGLGDFNNQCYYTPIVIDNCPIAPSCPDPDLGADRLRCVGFDSFDISAGLIPKGFEYTWFKENQIIEGPTIATSNQLAVYKVGDFGEYSIRIRDVRSPTERPCEPCTTAFDTLLVTPPPFELPTFTYCNDDITSVDAYVTNGNGIFEWYTLPTGGTLLGTTTDANTITINFSDIVDNTGTFPNRQKVVYVEDVSVFNSSGVLGETTPPCAANTNNKGNDRYHEITLFQDVTLDSVSFYAGTYFETSRNFRVEIYTANSSGSFNTGSPFISTPNTLVSGLSTSNPRLTKLGIERTLPGSPAGTKYWIRIAGENNAVTHYFTDCNNSYPTPDNITGTLGSFDGVWQNPSTRLNTFGAIFDLEISATYEIDYGCDRFPLFINEVCPCLISLTGNGVNPTCGNSNGNINITPTGSYINSYNYAWSGSGVLPTSEDQSNLTRGTYTVTVSTSENNACSTTSQFTLSGPDALIANIANPVSLLCNGSNNGSLDLSVTGGTSPYTYRWSNSATTQDITNLTAGTYIVTVSDGAGCTAITSRSITQPTQLEISSINKIDLNCFGDNNGRITVTASGGTVASAYSYNWSNNASNNSNINANLTGGIYTVTVRDDNNCTITSSSTIVEPTLLGSTLTQVNPTCYNSSNGSINTSITGGTSPYIYAWSTDPSQVSSNLENLSANTYTVTITDSNGCTNIRSSTLVAPPAPIVTINSAIVCKDSTVTISASPSFSSYTWSNNAITQSIRVGRGTYTLEVTNASGCTTISTATISEHPEVDFTSSPECSSDRTNYSLTITVTPNVTSVTANLGDTPINISPTEWLINNIPTINATGRDITITALDEITNCTVTKIISGPNCTCPSAIPLPNPGSNESICVGDLVPTLNAITNAGPTYQVYWYTSNTRTPGETPVNIGNTFTPNIADLSIGDNIFYLESRDVLADCYSERDSFIILKLNALPIVTITNDEIITCENTTATLTASGGLSYTWSSGDNGNGTASVSLAGDYTVTVTGANGCTSTTSVSVSGNTTLPTPTATVSNTISCTSTSATLTADGGTSYTWSSGDNGNGTADVTTAGNYTVTVTGANGCTSTTSVSVSGNTTLPTPTATVSNTISCTSTSATLTADGGTSYNWSSGDNGNGTADVTTAGNYTVTVTGANGCTSTTSVSVSGNTTLPTVTINPSNPTTLCRPTEILNVSNNPSLTYFWTGNGIVSGQNTSTLTVNAAGIYRLVVTNLSTECSSSIAVSIAPCPTVLSCTPAIPDELTCNNNTEILTATFTSPGLGTYTYNWSTGATDNLDGTASVNIVGTYTLTLTDTSIDQSVECEFIVNEDVALPIFTVSAVDSTINCFNSSELLTALPASSLTYIWSTGDNENTITVTDEGTYTVIATGVNGCTSVRTIVVNEDRTIPTVTIDATTLTGDDDNNNSITCNDRSEMLSALPSDLSLYEYLWNDLSTGESIEVTSQGDYTVTITSKTNGCTSIDNIEIIEDLVAPSASISANGTIRCDNREVLLTALPNENVSWSWNTLATIQSINVSNIGTYTVTVTNISNGCSDITTFILGGNLDTPTAIITGIDTINCSTSSTVLSGLNSLPSNVSYNWSTGGIEPTATITGTGVFILTVTDSTNGCTATATKLISSSCQPNCNIEDVTFNLTCANGGISTISPNYSSPTNPISNRIETFLWNTGDETSTLIVETAGIYIVTYTDESVTGTNTAICSVQIEDDRNNPTININGNQIDTLTCEKDSITFFFEAISNSVAENGLSIIWNPNTLTGSNVSVTSAGTYTVTVTDNRNGCTISNVFIVFDDRLNTPEVNITGDNTLDCSSNAAELTANAISNSIAGTANFLYNWSNNSVGNPIIVNEADTYTVIVTDLRNGCTSNASFLVTESNSVDVALSANNVNCSSPTSGSILVTNITGENPISYDWNIPNLDITAVSSGTYTLTATDNKGCSTVETITVSEDPFAANIITNNECDENITISNGSIGADQYSWNFGNGETSDEFGPFEIDYPIGTYTITLTARNTLLGCVDTQVRTVNRFAPVAYNMQGDTVCYGETASLQVINIDTALVSSITWGADILMSTDTIFLGNNIMFVKDDGSFPRDTALIDNSIIDSRYYTSIIDNNGCVIIDSADIKVILPARGEDIDITINPGTDVTLPLELFDYNLPTWTSDDLSELSCQICSNPVVNTSTLIRNQENELVYNVNVTDIYGACEVSFDYIINVVPELNIGIPSAFTPNNDGLNDYFYIHGNGVETISEMKVFNRWGNLLFFKKEFEANVAEEGWDGKVDGAFQNNDTYTYQVRLISVFDGKEIVKEGHFSLLR